MKKNGAQPPLGVHLVLNNIERVVPEGKAIHVILDNIAEHKHAEARAWQERHARWAFHSTPISGSWLNAIERIFARLTRRRPKRDVFRLLVDVQAAIKRIINEHNAREPKSPNWRAEADEFTAAGSRGLQMSGSTF